MILISNYTDHANALLYNNSEGEILDAYSCTIVDIARKVSRSVVQISVVKKQISHRRRRSAIMANLWKQTAPDLLSQPMDC